jgi:hypothetical protein
MKNPLSALKLTKVKLIGWDGPTDSKDGSKKIGEMELQVNPDSISHGHKTEVHGSTSSGTETSKNKSEGVSGASGVSTQLKQKSPETIGFKFTLDATGVIPGCEDVMDSIAKFKKIAYEYHGKKHDTPYVRLIWSKLFSSGPKGKLFECRLTSLSINYSLFKPSGKPLRAEVTVDFIEYQTEEERNLSDNRSSPDLTHVRVVRVGDNLPGMCKEVYGDARYYLNIARYNQLNSVFNIEPGQKIFFPPLDK